MLIVRRKSVSKYAYSPFQIVMTLYLSISPVFFTAVDPWKVLTLAAGIALFLSAPKLSKSALFFYSSGTCIGALAAALVLLFILSRMLPKVYVGDRLTADIFVKK